MKTTKRASVTLAALLALSAAPAMAHPEQGLAADFGAGFSHPLGGLDHLLAMLAVGLWAGRLGGRASWLVPASFLAMMALGALLGVLGLPVPGAELGVQASLLALGLAVSTSWWLQAYPAAAVAGFFALFHGYLHGAEWAPGADGVAYGLGFLTATAGLHGIGLAAAAGFGRRRRLFGAAGAMCVGVGVFLLTAG